MGIGSLSISLGAAIALLRRSRWGAAHEIRYREWEDAPRADSLCVVLSTDREELSARTDNSALLLRSQVLRRSLQDCHPSAPKACEGVMITADALKYLPQMGLDPSWMVGCAGTKCQNSFAL